MVLTWIGAETGPRRDERSAAPGDTTLSGEQDVFVAELCWLKRQMAILQSELEVMRMCFSVHSKVLSLWTHCMNDRNCRLVTFIH